MKGKKNTCDSASKNKLKMKGKKNTCDRASKNKLKLEGKKNTCDRVSKNKLKMKGKNNTCDRASSGHFNHLPDELLQYIFGKLSDLKTLCHCYIVSKRFASVISRIRDVSVTLPRDTTLYSLDYYRRVGSLFHDLRRFSHEQVPGEQSFHELKFPIFLEKFSELESLYLEYTIPRADDSSSLLKWKANFTSSTSVIDSFVAILPSSIQKKADYVPDQENSTGFNLSETLHSFRLSFGCYTDWLYLVCMLIKRNCTLKCVTITDSQKQGKLVVRDEQLLKIRSYLLNKERGVGNLKSFLKIAGVRDLHLPISGYVMKVCMMVIKVSKESNVSGGENDDDILALDFDHDEKVFREAIKEILKNHRDSIHTLEV